MPITYNRKTDEFVDSETGARWENASARSVNYYRYSLELEKDGFDFSTFTPSEFEANENSLPNTQGAIPPDFRCVKRFPYNGIKENCWTCDETAICYDNDKNGMVVGFYCGDHMPKENVILADIYEAAIYKGGAPDPLDVSPGSIHTRPVGEESEDQEINAMITYNGAADCYELWVDGEHGARDAEAGIKGYEALLGRNFAKYETITVNTNRGQ